MEYLRNPSRRIRHYISAPFIYMMMVPLIILQIYLETYHWICFPLYGIPLVRRSHHFKFDRHKLTYLKFMQKFNCVYCAYANGLISYAREIASRTERYWCGIKHSGNSDFIQSQYQKDFLEYGDEKGYRRYYETKD